MNSIERQLRDIQREIDALSANQAPNPADIATFAHSVTVAAAMPAVKTATFSQGLKSFKAYLSDSTVAYMEQAVSGSVVTFNIWASAQVTLTVVSLGEFSLA